MEIMEGLKPPSDTIIPIVPAGAIVHHTVFGEGQVIGIQANFTECQTKTIDLPYLRSLQMK